MLKVANVPRVNDVEVTKAENYLLLPNKVLQSLTIRDVKDLLFRRHPLSNYGELADQ